MKREDPRAWRPAFFALGIHASTLFLIFAQLQQLATWVTVVRLVVWAVLVVGIFAKFVVSPKSTFWMAVVGLAVWFATAW